MICSLCSHPEARIATIPDYPARFEPLCDACLDSCVQLRDEVHDLVAAWADSRRSSHIPVPGPEPEKP